MARYSNDAKIQIKNDSVKNFGRFFSFVDHFHLDEMVEIICKALGNSWSLTKYSNADILLSLATIFLVGVSCIKDAKRLSDVFTEITRNYDATDIIRCLIKGARDLRFMFPKKNHGYDGLMLNRQQIPCDSHFKEHKKMLFFTKKSLFQKKFVFLRPENNERKTLDIKRRL